MANVKGRPKARSHRKMKGRRRKPNIAALVYKYLSLGGKQAEARTSPTYNQNSARSPIRHKELRHSLNSQIAGTRNMVNKRKESNKNSKARRIKRGYTSKNATPSSCICKRNGEGIKKMKKYIQKALDFGVESGYLIPKDTTYKVLRVSSDLVSEANYLRNRRNSDRAVSRDRDRSPHRKPIKFDDYGVQEPSKSQRSLKRQRSRSGSRRRKFRRRKRGRRRSRSGNRDEEIVENDDYKYDNQPEKKSSTENASRKEGNEPSNQSDEEKTTKRAEEDGSDLSADEDETEDEEKKEDDTKKS